mgnify:CR=1 FL=1
MKKIMMSIIVCFIVSLFLVSVYAQSSAERITRGANIRINFVNQEPDPVEAGGNVDVRFKVENIGGDEAKDVEFEIVPEFPFSLEPGEDGHTDLGTLQSRQVGDEGAIIKYGLLVDENAVEAEKILKIRYRSNKEAWVTVENFTIDIRTRDAILAIDSVATDKKSLEPGTTNRLTLTLSNQGDSVLRNIEVKLDLENTQLVPIGSGNEKNIYQISARSKQDIVFTLLVDPEAESGIAKVPVKLSYNDQVGTRFIRNNTIGLIVGAEPDLSITLDESTIYQPGQSGEVTVKVVNKGVSNIKFTNVKLLGADYIRPLSNTEIYLGNIDSDDFESATFKVFVDSNGNGALTLPIQLDYKDANNNEFSKKIDLPLNLYSSKDAKKFGLTQGSSMIGIVIVVVIVVAGLLIFRRYWKRRKK